MQIDLTNYKSMNTSIVSGNFIFIQIIKWHANKSNLLMKNKNLVTGEKIQK